MSFNIRNSGAEDGKNSWKYRRKMVESIVKFHHTDIVGCQEVLKDQLDDLIDLLPSYGWVGVGRDDGLDAGEFAPIFYLKDRFEVLKSGTFWLSGTPDVAGSRGWDAACIRIATWAKLKEKNTGKIHFYFNTHFDHVGQVAMEESSYLLLRKITELAGDYPAVITGDFNNTECSKVYNILTGKERGTHTFDNSFLKDSKYCSENGHHGPSFTYHDFKAAKIFYELAKGKSSSQDQQMCLIDYIFVKNNIRVFQHGILSDNWDGRYPSDHMPVVADIEIL